MIERFIQCEHQGMTYIYREAVVHPIVQQFLDNYPVPEVAAGQCDEFATMLADVFRSIGEDNFEVYGLLVNGKSSHIVLKKDGVWYDPTGIQFGQPLKVFTDETMPPIYQIHKKLDNRQYTNNKMEKTYVTNPSDAPEGVALKTGPKGGKYYDEPGEKKSDDKQTKLPQQDVDEDGDPIDRETYPYGGDDKGRKIRLQKGEWTEDDGLQIATNLREKGIVGKELINEIMKEAPSMTREDAAYFMYRTSGFIFAKTPDSVKYGPGENAKTLLKSVGFNSADELRKHYDDERKSGMNPGEIATRLGINYRTLSILLSETEETEK